MLINNTARCHRATTQLSIADSAFTKGLSIAPPARAANVLIDFGAVGTQTATDAQGRIWTNVPDATDQTGSPFTLRASATGADTGYRLSVSNPAGVTTPVGFNGANSAGTPAPTGTALARNYPASATADSLYGNTVTFGAGVVQAVRITLANLSPTELYALDFFASRTGSADNRETEYHVLGGNTDTSVFLNAANNTGNLTGLAGIAPDANNTITIDIDPGPNNNNANGFFYLGVLELNSSPAPAVPEPAGALATTVAAALATLRRRRRKPTRR
jgi:hypothetical protein